jgi:hypothetical protein
MAKAETSQLRHYSTDLLLAASSLTPIQLNAYLVALQYEWDYGHAPEGLVWMRFVQAKNQHQKREVEDIAKRYSDLPYTRKIRKQKTAKPQIEEAEILESDDQQYVGQDAAQDVAQHTAQDVAAGLNPNAHNAAGGGNEPPSSSASSSTPNKTKYTPLPPEMRAVGIPANAEDEARSEIARAITVALGWGIAPSQTLADRATSAAANLLKLAQDYGEAYAPNRELIAGFDAYTKAQRWTRKWSEAALVAHWKAYVDSTAKKATSTAPPRTACPDCVDPTQPGWHWKNADGTGGLVETDCKAQGEKNG